MVLYFEFRKRNICGCGENYPKGPVNTRKGETTFLDRKTSPFPHKERIIASTKESYPVLSIVFTNTYKYEFVFINAPGHPAPVHLLFLATSQGLSTSYHQTAHLLRRPAYYCSHPVSFPPCARCHHETK